MIRFPRLASLLLLLAGLFSIQSGIAAEPIQFTIIKTGTATTPEALAYSGGNLTTKVTLNHAAVLVRHGSDLFLFDTGLGAGIDAQFGHDMPFWAKPLFAYQRLTPAAEQLPEAIKRKISTIYLSHVHWDHASGLKDFQGPCTAIIEEEKVELEQVSRAATFPTQFSDPAPRWCNYQWSAKPFLGFSQSHDIFGDGNAVLVPLPGHTHGSVGLYLQLKEKRVLFVGDLTWSRRGLMAGKQKFWGASILVDRDRGTLGRTLEQVRDLAKSRPDLVIVPAHDSEAQDEFGYFPKWVE